MTTTKIDKENLIIRVDGGESIGLLLMYSIPDKPYNRETLKKAYEDNNLDVEKLPDSVRGYNAFKRATNIVNRKSLRDEVLASGSIPNTEQYAKVEFSVHDIPNTSETANFARRNLVIKKAKPTGNNDSLDALEFDEKVCTFVHDNQLEIIGSTVSENYRDNAFIQEIVRRVEEEYDTAMNHFSATQVRNTLRTHISHMRAMPMLRTGGGYFISNEYREEALNFAKMIKDIGGTSIFFNMMNGESDREQLRSRYNEFCDDFLRIVETQAYKDKEKFPKREFETFLRKVKEANEDYAKYVEILQIDQAQIQERQNQLKVATLELLRHAEVLEEEKKVNQKRSGRKPKVR